MNTLRYFFKTNFKQATLLPLPLIAVLAVLVVEIAYLLTSGQGVAMLFVMIIVAVFLAVPYIKGKYFSKPVHIVTGGDGNA